MTAARQELSARRFVRALTFGAIGGGLIDLLLYVLVVPWQYWGLGAFGVGMVLLAAFSVFPQTHAIGRLQSAPRLTPAIGQQRRIDKQGGRAAPAPASNPPMSALPPPSVRRGVFIRPEIKLPPGFVLPSVRLAPPESVPPLTSMPLVVLETPPPTGVAFAALELGLARISAALGPCAHADAVPVDLLVTGERVACVCPKCDARLPAEWLP